MTLAIAPSKLNQYIDLLQQWNPHITLIAKKECADRIFLQERHINNSLSLIPHLPHNTQHIVDIGSGGGLPAIPLALATNAYITCVESDKKKSAFLREAMRQLHIQGNVISARVEHMPTIDADIITARAFAPLDKLFHLCYNHLQYSRLLLLKGQKVEEEIEKAKKNFAFSIYLHHKHSQGCILGIEKNIERL